MFLAFLAGNCAFAINSEFKNTLTGVELTKTGEENYSVNLYTSKKFSSPIRIIKKSDLSYYILLPETNNATSQINVISPDIRNISTNLYPYAGVDVHNGYTKININTTKPINFNVTTKSSTAPKTADTSSVASNSAKTLPSSTQEEKNQKKNLEFQKADIAQKQASQSKKEIKQQTAPYNDKVSEAKKGQNKVSSTTKTTVNKTSSAKIVNNRANTLKSSSKPLKTAQKQEVKQPVKPSAVEKKTTKPAQSYMAAAKLDIPEKKVEKQPESPEIQQIDIYMPDISDEIIQEEKVQEAVENVTNNNFEAVQPQKPVVTVKNISLGNVFKKFVNVIKTTMVVSKDKVIRFNSKFIDKLAEYGLSFGDLIFIVFAGIFTFVAMLFILGKNQNQPKLKAKADLSDKKSSSPAPKSFEESGKDEGQYFVFEKNIRQTELLEPATSNEKKNYELVSYDPDLRENYTDMSEKTNNEDEDLDIIHKILKEDSFIELNDEGKLQEQNVITEQKETVIEPVKHPENVTSPIGQEHVKKEVEIQKEDILEENVSLIQNEENGLEPKLISSKAISPEQGFMLISYQNNINLMGYIFDDVFALHNFKAAELNNYNIEARLVDKDDQGSVYIVKADGIRLLVKVTKTSMSTEVTL